MSDDIINDYKNASATLINIVLNNPSLLLSAEERHKLEKLRERKLFEMNPKQTIQNEKELKKPVSSENIVKIAPDFCINIEGENRYLVRDLMKRFHPELRPKLRKDILLENLATITNEGIYVTESLRKRLENFVDIYEAHRNLEIYPYSIDILVEEGRIITFSKRIDYLLCAESLKKVKQELSVSDRILLNCESRRRARLGEKQTIVGGETDLFDEDYD